MSAFFDARCSKCKRRVSWVGTAADQPPCKCGHQDKPDPEVERMMENLEKEILRKRNHQE